MNNSFHNLVIYNGYPLSVVVAVIFHSLILALLLYLQSNRSTEALELIQPTVVKALIVQENPQVANERKRLERQQQRVRQQEEARVAEAERQRQEKARAEKQRQERERAALRERQKQERLNAEQLRKEKEQRERREKEREREERERKEQERRQRELAEAQRQQEIRDREQREAAELATSEFEMVQSGTALIQQLVQERWSRPPSARNGMRAVLQIRMLPTGELVDAVITQSSGDPAFDRSAENAVYRAAPFRELQNLPINVFNANFRSLSLIFEPEDLLN
jgi:colicin import membrane protein